MPGHYVFPGGRAGREDSRPWQGETLMAHDTERPSLSRLARTALRETFEETGLVVGRREAEGTAQRLALAASEIEHAYAGRGMTPALDLLRYIGRAITPSGSPIRFHARFFLADGGHAAGEPRAGEELEDVHWHGLDAGPPEPMSDVTRFMLDHAVAVWRGTAPQPIAFYRYIRGVPVSSAQQSKLPSASLASLPQNGRRSRGRGR